MIVNLLSFQVNIFTPTLSFLAQCFPALLGSPGLAVPRPTRSPDKRSTGHFVFPAHPHQGGGYLIFKIVTKLIQVTELDNGKL